jgi:hypothetical protein
VCGAGCLIWKNDDTAALTILSQILCIVCINILWTINTGGIGSSHNRPIVMRDLSSSPHQRCAPMRVVAKYLLIYNKLFFQIIFAKHRGVPVNVYGLSNSILSRDIYAYSFSYTPSVYRKTCPVPSGGGALVTTDMVCVCVCVCVCVVYTSLFASRVLMLRIRLVSDQTL